MAAETHASGGARPHPAGCSTRSAANVLPGSLGLGNGDWIDESAGKEQTKGKVDFEWDDDYVALEVLNPDGEFWIRRMNEATHEKVDPKEGERILDIGCGRAVDGVDLAKRGAVVIGLEPSNVMIARAKSHIAENGVHMAVIWGVGEHLPFRPQSLDKVVCKGALDHFVDPAMVMQQMAMALKPEGKAIISIANFGSLGFKLGKGIWWLMRLVGFKDGGVRMPWEPPSDHTYRFDYALLKRMASSHLEVEQATGASLLFGVPWWGSLLAKCPQRLCHVILITLDRIAQVLPSLSDVVVLRCRPSNGGPTLVQGTSAS